MWRYRIYPDGASFANVPYSPVKAAKVEVDAGRMPLAMLGRLDLGRGDKWESMIKGVQDVGNLPDPTGIVTYAMEIDDGLELYRASCPIGVLLVIFEARPEVFVNIAALAIKSGKSKHDYTSRHTNYILYR